MVDDRKVTNHSIRNGSRQHRRSNTNGCYLTSIRSIPDGNGLFAICTGIFPSCYCMCTNGAIPIFICRRRICCIDAVKISTGGRWIRRPHRRSNPQIQQGSQHHGRQHRTEAAAAAGNRAALAVAFRYFGHNYVAISNFIPNNLINFIHDSNLLSKFEV